MIKILIYGVRGYIGNILKNYLLKNSNIIIIESKYPKIFNDKQILDDITLSGFKELRNVCSLEAPLAPKFTQLTLVIFVSILGIVFSFKLDSPNT